MKKITTILLLGVLSWTGSVTAQTRPDLMYCGSTSASGASLYSGAGPFNEILGNCSPDIDTQALLVTRSGSVGGNGAAWLAYLNAGGIIVTEYSNSDNVYNEIFGTAYAQGSSQGGCGDNSMPAVKINPTHPFWVSNPITETASQEGCGYDIAAIVAGEVEVTALGGWSSGATSFAYRPQGSGVLVLLDADWQDGESSYSDDSRAFMGAVLGGGVTGAVAPPPAPAAATPVPTMSEWALITLAMLLAGVVFVRRKQLS